MEFDNSLRTEVIKMITEEKEALSAYKGLCARFNITPDPIPEAVTRAKLQVLEMVLKSLHT